MFFGVFHIHRIWGLLDRRGYSDFWLSVMHNRNAFYFVLMGVLTLLCIVGIAIFIKNRGNNYWWRWIYICGGGYLIFDLLAILIQWAVWENLLYWMLNITNPYWNGIWGLFICLGAFSLALGIALARKFSRQNM
jgi:hypothetical protein